MYQSGDIILNMNKNNKDKNNDEDNDCKLSVQEKKQADEKKKAKEENPAQQRIHELDAIRNGSNK